MGQDTEIVEGYSVSEVAEILGISKNAVRKRVQRESLPATKVEGEWRIFLQDEATGTTKRDSDTGQGIGQDIPQDVAIDIARQQLETFRDAFVLPLVDRIGKLEHDNGQLEVENRHLNDEVGELRQRISELEAPPSEDFEDSEEATELVWWRRWLGLGERHGVAPRDRHNE